MHALIVVAHHNPKSLTHGIAAQIAEAISRSNPQNSHELADIAGEGFDPRFSPADAALHSREAAAPADVAAEQARIDRADALVIVYPVYWWSMPGLLKGWIDRVFANGWAFDFSLDSSLIKKLGHLQVHLVGVAGADAQTYERHGCLSAMKIQIDQGIFGYCGARVVTSELLFESETRDPALSLRAADEIGRGIFAPVAARQSVEAV